MLQPFTLFSKQDKSKLSRDILSDITIYMKYAKYIPELKRRETWDEICNRIENMFIKKYGHLGEEFKKEIVESIKYVREKKVLTSMRASQFAGPAIEKNNARIFNCSYLPMDSIRGFYETLFLLLGGSGVGYSVQKHHIEKLPMVIGPDNSKKPHRFLIGDSIEGWADAIKALVEVYFKGKSQVVFDYSDIREKGAELITAGGKAPGPEPLRVCIENVKAVFDKVIETRGRGSKLRSIEVHDIICHIADSVYAGGIRRAALIAGFSVDDDLMLSCKSNFRIKSWEHHVEKFRGNLGEWEERVVCIESKNEKYYNINVTYEDPSYGEISKTLYYVDGKDIEKLKTEGTLPWFYFHPQRGRSNNSVVLMRDKLDKETFDWLWSKTKESKAGEPGFYLTNDKDYFGNPCQEIGLKPRSFCNLTEVNASDIDTQEEFNKRARIGAFIGTLQAGFTDFHYLSQEWRDNAEKEALIGVGMTGIANSKFMNLNFEEASLEIAKENERVSSIIGINKAHRAACVKPSGTTSLVVGSSSGVHAWHNDYYIRRIRVGKNEAIYHYLVDNVPNLIEDDFFSPETTAVLSIPQKAPNDAMLRTESPIETLERVKKIYKDWIKTSHRKGPNTNNVSCTISLKDEEWETVGKWMWDNKEFYNGVSVLPYDGGTYKQAPFEDCTKEKYEEMLVHLKSIDLTKIIEESDNTDLKGELACAGGACEVK